MYLFELVFSLELVLLPPVVGRDMHTGNDCLCPSQRVCASLFPLSVCALVGSGSLYYSGGRCQSKKSWSRAPSAGQGVCWQASQNTRLFLVCCLSTVLEQGGRWGWGWEYASLCTCMHTSKAESWFLTALQ